MNVEETNVPIENSPKPTVRRTRRPAAKKAAPRQSVNDSIRDIFLKHNQIAPVKTEVKSQSAHQRRRSRVASLRPVTSAEEQRIPPPLTCPSFESISSSTRSVTGSSSLRDFRLHPERYLSPNNRYLPLLRRQATEVKKASPKISTPTPMPVYVDFITEGAKSFLSDDLEASKLRAPTKINLLEPPVDDDHGRRLALNSLRNREYEHLQRLIQSNPIEKIVEPMVEKETHAPDLDQLLRSIDSLGSPADRHRRRRPRVTNFDKTHSNLAILIF